MGADEHNPASEIARVAHREAMTPAWGAKSGVFIRPIRRDDRIYCPGGHICHLELILVTASSRSITQASTFLAELQRRGRPRCRSYWLCGLGGYLLGLITGLLGRRAIAATTVAVEAVVLKHLEHQLSVLSDSDPAATTAISAIVSEERQHHDQSEAHLEGHGFWRATIEPVVSVSTEAVIWLGMRL